MDRHDRLVELLKLARVSQEIADTVQDEPSKERARHRIHDVVGYLLNHFGAMKPDNENIQSIKAAWNFEIDPYDAEILRQHGDTAINLLVMRTFVLKWKAMGDFDHKFNFDRVNHVATWQRRNMEPILRAQELMHELT